MLYKPEADLRLWRAHELLLLVCVFHRRFTLANKPSFGGHVTHCLSIFCVG